jgi:pimeloyl-ACP methyl ester carboxylesterase
VPLSRRTALLLLASAASLAASPAHARRHRLKGIGIILLHGKGGMPNPWLIDFAERMESEGAIVLRPEMPWSSRRHLDVGIDDAFGQIDREYVEIVRRGAKRIVMAGHSLGANIALAYAVQRNPVDGVMMLGAGHAPEIWGGRDVFRHALEEAQQLVADGRGGEERDFPDLNQGRMQFVRTQAWIYAEYFDPAGRAAMTLNAPRLGRTPLLYVVGTRDRIHRVGRAFIFDRAPKNHLSRYVELATDHMNTPDAARDVAVSWLTALGRKLLAAATR